MTAASLLRETMWSMVSEIHSTARLRLCRLHGREPARASRRAYATYPSHGAAHERPARPPRKIVIIGGGIVGCSTAYHLGKHGQDRRRCCSSAAS